jgi:integrase
LDPEVSAVPRNVRDANLETRTARARLRVRHKPFFRMIEQGLHLGYRKLASGPGTWLVRRYSGEGRYRVENLRTPDGGALVLADDYADADGARIMTFAQAQKAARGPRAAAAGGLTVADVMAAYLEHLKRDGRSPHAIRDARYRIEALILPKLGSVKIASLTPDRLRRWRDDVTTAPPRLRTRPGEEQNHRKLPSDDDGRRARRATSNRTWTVLRAALNFAFHDGKIESDAAWRRVKPFKQVESARVRYLTIAEAKRLVNACEPEFRPLVQAALQTGCRYGELVRLMVRDYNPDSGTLAIRQSKAGKARHVVLSEEGNRLIAALTAGRAGADLMLRRADGEPWGASHQARPMREACERAKINPAISFHGLRHTWASLAVMGSMPLMVVARNLGHVDTRMVEKHYGHLAPSFVADAVRKHAPKFGMKASGDVVTPMRRGSQHG